MARGALAHHSRRELVAGLVHQRAREVLALAHNDALVETALDRCPIRSCRTDDRERLHAVILAVAAIGVGIEVADERSLDSRARHCMEWADGVVLGQGDGQLADATRLGEANGGSGGVADIVYGRLALLAKTHNQQALGGQSRRARAAAASRWLPALNSPLASTAAAAAVRAAIRAQKRWSGLGIWRPSRSAYRRPGRRGVLWQLRQERQRTDWSAWTDFISRLHRCR